MSVRNREFIELLAYCHRQAFSEEKLDESVKRLVGTYSEGISIEKLCALLGNQLRVDTTGQPDDKINIKAREQLVGITGLMHQTNYNGHYQSTNNSIQ